MTGFLLLLLAKLMNSPFYHQTKTMIYNLNLTRVLFLDVETAPQFPDYFALDENGKRLWDKKASQLKTKEEGTPDELI
jgi:hypothetical protein